MNKIVAISMVKNEEDIIESFVRYTLTFSDEILVVNHNSDDLTGEILEKLQQEGLPIHIEMFLDPRHLQSEIMTKLMYLAIEQYDADIIIPLDADEFLLPFDNNISIRNYLQIMSVNDIVKLPWYIHRFKLMINVKDEFALNRQAIRSTIPHNMSKIIIGAGVLKKNKKMFLRQGNHALQEEDNQKCIIYGIQSSDLYLAHFDIRSEQQYLSKIVIGALADIAKYSNDACSAPGWRKKFKKYMETGKLEIPDVDQPTDVMYKHNFPLQLMYTKRSKYDLFSRVLKLSAGMAHKLSLEKVRSERWQIGIICFLSTDYKSCEDTVKSIINQHYDSISCIFVDREGECKNIYQKLKNIIFTKNKKIQYQYTSLFIYRNMNVFFNNIVGCDKWDYVQLLKPGDILMKDKLLSSVKVLKESENADIVLCNVCYKCGKYTNLIFNNNENTILFAEEIMEAIQDREELLFGLPVAFLFKSTVIDLWRNIPLPYISNQPVFMEMFQCAILDQHTLISYIADVKASSLPTSDEEYITHQIERIIHFTHKLSSYEIDNMEMQKLLKSIKENSHNINIESVEDKELINIFLEIIN